MKSVELLYSGYFCGESKVAFHEHDGNELVYVDSGECNSKIGEFGEFYATSGMIFVVPKKTQHDQINHGECKTYYSVMQLNSQYYDCSARVIDTRKDILIRNWFKDLQHLNTFPNQANFILGAIWARLSELEGELVRKSALHPGLAKAVEIIDANYYKDIEIAELAVLAGVSASHLNLLFREEFMVGASRYLRNIRMEHAQNLLKNPYLTVSEIAEKCGYDSGNYFSRIFRECFHLSPSEFRENRK